MKSISIGLAALALAGVTGTALAAKPYPTNQCVSAKQKEAGAYCQRVLKAWSGWEGKQDGAKRDAAFAKADAKLHAAWLKAELNAEKAGVDCAQTTLTADATRGFVDSAIGVFVADVNSSLDLGNKDHAKCGGKVLAAAATQCLGLMKSESLFVKSLAKDPTGAKRNAAQNKVHDKFIKSFFKATDGPNCPIGVSVVQAQVAVDLVVHDLVQNTTNSPNVDPDVFTTISPTGTTSYLGKDLKPVCMNGSPYSFFVKRGTTNKVVMYYQGGGACWEQLTCSVPVCDSNVDVNGGDNPNNGLPHPGFADLSNPNNPFADWTIVFISYCSCDIHFGDAAQDYDNNTPGTPLHVEHRGFHNARYVEKWAREHFVNPDAVFVTGSSAGAYGAWFHAPLLQEVWPASKFSVLADAGNGVITQDFLDTQFPHWNFEANLPSDHPEIQQVFDDKTGIPGYTKVVANLFPNTTWAHYATAFDGGFGGQTGFYNVMLNDNDPIAALSWWEGSCAFNAKMRQQAIDTAAAIPSNYRYYIGTGSRHTMWGSNKVYTDTTGGVPTIVSWVNAMLNSDGVSADPGWTNVECTNCGLLLPGDVRPTPTLQPPFVDIGGGNVEIQCSASGAFID